MHLLLAMAYEQSGRLLNPLTSTTSSQLDPVGGCQGGTGATSTLTLHLMHVTPFLGIGMTCEVLECRTPHRRKTGCSSGSPLAHTGKGEVAHLKTDCESVAVEEALRRLQRAPQQTGRKAREAQMADLPTAIPGFYGHGPSRRYCCQRPFG